MTKIDSLINKFKKEINKLEKIKTKYPDIIAECISSDISYDLYLKSNQGHLINNVEFDKFTYGFYANLSFKTNNTIIYYNKISRLIIINYNNNGSISYDFIPYEAKLRRLKISDKIIKKIDIHIASFIKEANITVDPKKINNRVKTYLYLS